MTIEASQLSGLQKAAIVVTQMPPEMASAVLAQLSEADVSRLSRAVANLPELEPGPVQQVMADFVCRVQALAAVAQGGPEAARRLLRERFGAQRADEELEMLLRDRDRRPFSFLSGVDPARLAGFLSEEHPQLVAVVVAHLPPELAAGVLGAMEDDRRSEVALRVGTMGKVPPEALQAIVQALSGQVLSMESLVEEGAGGGGVATLAAILNRSDRAVERQVLGQVEASDPDLAEEIRRRLFTFEDVLGLDDRTLQKVLRAIQPKTLALALKGAPEEVRQPFLRNLSENAAKDLAEEIEYLGAVRLVEVEGAQMDVARKVRELEAAGEITILRKGDDVVV